MGRVLIFGMGGVIVVGLLMLLIFGGSLSAKLASLMWRKKKNDKEESNDEGDEGPHGPVGYGSGSGWV